METFDFLKLAKKRYACRKYSDRQVEPEKLARILEAGRVAAHGRQPAAPAAGGRAVERGDGETGALHARFRGSDGHRRLRRHLRGVDPQIRRQDDRRHRRLDRHRPHDALRRVAGARHAVDLHVQARGRARGVRAAPARGAREHPARRLRRRHPVRSRPSRHAAQADCDETVFHEHF